MENKYLTYSENRLKKLIDRQNYPLEDKELVQQAYYFKAADIQFNTARNYNKAVKLAAPLKLINKIPNEKITPLHAIQLVLELKSFDSCWHYQDADYIAFSVKKRSIKKILSEVFCVIKFTKNTKDIELLAALRIGHTYIHLGKFVRIAPKSLKDFYINMLNFAEFTLKNLADEQLSILNDLTKIEGKLTCIGYGKKHLPIKFHTDFISKITESFNFSLLNLISIVGSAMNVNSLEKAFTTESVNKHVLDAYYYTIALSQKKLKKTYRNICLVRK